MRCRHARDVRAVCAPDHSRAGWGGARVGGTLGRDLRHGEKRHVFFIEQQRSELSLRRVREPSFSSSPLLPLDTQCRPSPLVLASRWTQPGRKVRGVGRERTADKKSGRRRAGRFGGLLSPPPPLVTHSFALHTHTPQLPPPPPGLARPRCSLAPCPPTACAAARCLRAPAAAPCLACLARRRNRRTMMATGRTTRATRMTLPPPVGGATSKTATSAARRPRGWSRACRFAGSRGMGGACLGRW